MADPGVPSDRSPIPPANLEYRGGRIGELPQAAEGVNSRAFLDTFYKIVQGQFPHGAQLLEEFKDYCFDAIVTTYPDIKTISHYFSLPQAGKILGIADSHDAAKTLQTLIKDGRIYSRSLSTPQLKVHGKNYEEEKAPRGQLVSLTGEQSNYIPADSLLMHRTLQQWVEQKDPSSSLQRSAMVLGDLTVLSSVDDSLALPTLWDAFIQAHEFPGGVTRHNWQDLANESKFTKVKELVGRSS